MGEKEDPTQRPRGDRRWEQQHGHNGPHLFGTHFACKCLERAVGRRRITAQAGLLHPSALQDARSPQGHPSMVSRGYPWKKGFPTSFVVASRPVRSWAALYISMAPARKSRSENPSEVKKPLPVPQHSAGGSLGPVVDAGAGGRQPIPTQGRWDWGHWNIPNSRKTIPACLEAILAQPEPHHPLLA